MSEQGDQWEERDQEGHNGGSSGSSLGGTSGSPSEADNRGDSSSGETPPSRGDLPSEEDRKEGTQRANRESGTDEAGSHQGDVAHEGDLPTEGVPEAG